MSTTQGWRNRSIAFVHFLQQKIFIVLTAEGFLTKVFKFLITSSYLPNYLPTYLGSEREIKRFESKKMGFLQKLFNRFKTFDDNCTHTKAIFKNAFVVVVIIFISYSSLFALILLCCCCHDDVVVLCYCCCCNDDVVVLCCYDVPIYHFSKENISPLMGIKLGLVHWSNCLDLWVIYLPILCYHWQSK